MKPFNLEEALAGKAVMLRNGEKAFVRHHETEILVKEDMRLIGILPDGTRMAWCDGGHYYSQDITNSYDIIGMYPETRVINGFEVPAPETEELVHDTDFYLASPIAGQLYMGSIWDGNRTDKFRLERGLVFLNKEDAIATAKAMLGIDPNSGGDELIEIRVK